MIEYETYCQIRRLVESGLSYGQVSRELNLDPETVGKYAQMSSFPRRATPKRETIIAPYKPVIARWLERHPYSAQQVFQMLRKDEGYRGGYTSVKEYVRFVRPVRPAAYLTLAFAPGEAAQVDWGCAGAITIGNTRRRLSFFVMVLCHSRMMYVEFTCGESTEHFLACHQNGLQFFGGTPQAIIIDNLKTGVLEHRHGQDAVFNPRYLEFAAHYGFTPRACNVRQAHEKGRVENGVGYVKKNFLAGLEFPHSLSALNAAGRQWLDTIANVRLHKETRQRPCDLFLQERPALRPLPSVPADTGVTRLIRATNQCRVVLDTNRYSVPSLYASQRLTLTVFADRLCLYHAQNLVASHPRSYEKHRDFENPDHVKELLEQRRRARDAKWLLAFYALSPQAEYYHQQLQNRSLNARQHINKIVALRDIYGAEKVAQALQDAIPCQAFSSQYIENILEQRARLNPTPGPLHLTRRADLLDLELAPADLSLYDKTP
jgi:transposase